MSPASALLALTCGLLNGCGGIVPAVAGETFPVPIETPTGEPEAQSAMAQEARAPTPLPQAPGGKASPDPAPAAVPSDEDQSGFARFIRYALASAQLSGSGAQLPSALLADPVALDGKRRRCAAGEQLVVVIDLDPAGGLFAPPAEPVAATGIVAGLALLRDTGFEITWISDLPTERSGAVRTALEQSGLDPRGQDIISLRREEGDTKDQRKESLGGFACIVASAGDERADFDSRFKYLRSPEVGAAIEPIVGDGWFLVAPLITNQGL
jgi:hypothetical protein